MDHAFSPHRSEMLSFNSLVTAQSLVSALPLENTRCLGNNGRIQKNVWEHTFFFFSSAFEAPFLGENLQKSGWGSSTKKQVSRFSSSGLGLKEKNMYSWGSRSWPAQWLFGKQKPRQEQTVVFAGGKTFILPFGSKGNHQASRCIKSSRGKGTASGAASRGDSYIWEMGDTLLAENELK